jgi:hypothetical protein
MGHAAFVPAMLKGAADRFAIDGQQPAGGKLDHRRHPVQEAAFKGIGIKACKDAAERVMRRDAAAKIQESGQPLLFAFAPEGDLSPAIGPADHGKDGDDDQIMQFVDDAVAGTGVGNVAKKAQKASGRSGVHAKAPCVKALRDDQTRARNQ